MHGNVREGLTQHVNDGVAEGRFDLSTPTGDAGAAVLVVVVPQVFALGALVHGFILPPHGADRNWRCRSVASRAFGGNRRGGGRTRRR